MTRLVDRGAIVAAFVGVGMAVTMAIGFLLVIPIQPAYMLLAIPGGMIIGYYANARSGRFRGAWRRVIPNAILAGGVTGLTLAMLLLAAKAVFFFGDSGYPDFNRVDQSGAPTGPTCQPGADCVYHRYVAAQPDDLAAAGVTDAQSFASIYWREQTGAAELLVAVTIGAALFGAVLFGVAGPRRSVPIPTRSTVPA